MNIVGDKNLPKLRSEAHAQIDAQAQLERARNITSGMEATYAIKFAEAETYQRVGMTTNDTDYPHLSAEVGITGPDMATVAAKIISASLAWKDTSARIEKARLQAKKNVTEADNPEDITLHTIVIWPNTSLQLPVS